MMNAYLLIKTVHIITSPSCSVRGLASRFSRSAAAFTDRVQEKLFAIRTNVLADCIVIASAASMTF
jgi:hypothetical protein